MLIKYIIGIARNSRLEKQAEHLIQKARDQFEKYGENSACSETLNMLQTPGNMNAV